MNRSDQIKHLAIEALSCGAPVLAVCADQPDLVLEVQEFLSKYDSVRRELDSFFPTDDEGDFEAATLLTPHIDGYDEVEYLGSGAFGIVFRARHLGLKRLVAIKLPCKGNATTDEQRAAFREEAETLAALGHPNIVTIYDVGEQACGPFLAMEFLDGGTLAREMAGRPIAVGMAVDRIVTLGGAVQAAHAGGILHRDLKPSNVLFTREGTLKVTDFGLAHQTMSAAGTGNARPRQVGTPSYMSPEQARGDADRIGPSTDVYSLGAILYEMLTGRPPFLGVTVADTLRQLLSQEIVPPRQLNQQVPRDLETVCLKALSKDPSRRYPSAADFVADLERFRRGEPVTARATGPIERLSKWVKRRQLLAISVLVCAVLLLVLTVLLTLWGAHRWHNMRESRQMLDQVVASEQQEDWNSARNMLLKAQVAIRDLGNTALLNRLAEAQHNLGIADRIFAIRESHAVTKDGWLLLAKSPQMYLELFKDESLGGPDNDPHQTASRIMQLPVHSAFETATDDWLLCETDANRQRWLLAVGREIDRDPDGLRTDLRDPTVWTNAAELRRRIENRPLDKFPVPFLLAVIDQLKRSGENQIPTLLRAQRAHPNDFWVNLTAGDACLNANRSAQALEFYSAAVAIRPDSTLGWHNLSQALASSNRLDEASETLRIALVRDPTSVPTMLNLGICLSALKKSQESVALLRQVLRHDPQSPGAHWYLGESLADLGNADEGLSENRIGAMLAPSNRNIQLKLRDRLLRIGNLSEACDVWKRVIPANHAEDHDGYAELCLLTNHTSDYDRECQYLLSLLSASSTPSDCEHIGRACLLGSTSDAVIRRASEAIDRAVAAETPQKTWARSYYLFAQGLAAYRQGDDARAVAIEAGEASSALGPAPKLVAALAESHRGNASAAREFLAAADRQFDWHAAPKNREEWIYCILYNQARSALGLAPTSQPYR